MHDPVAELKARLAASGHPCEIVARHGATAADIRFVGPFEGREVAWEARVEAVTGPQFIEIGEPVGAVFPIRVGLNLAAIDEPALAKAVIMIRGYKRLRRGHHEFTPG
jgi:hypothetical protein